MSGQRAFRVSLSVLLVVAMVLSVGLVLPAGAAPAKRGEVPKRPQSVTTASGEQIAAKMDSKLQVKVAAAGRTESFASHKVDVAVLARKNSTKPAGMIHPLKMKLRADSDHDLWVGKAEVGSLTKIATSEDVAFVYENGRREPPVVPDSAGDTAPKNAVAQRKAQAEFKSKLDAAKYAGALDTFATMFNDDGTLISEPPITYEDGAATGWFDVSAEGHNSVGAWDQGYTGTGVKVAVADDSVDFGHPDLMGTNAVIDDAASPYDGWPQAFDPFSLLLYAYDAYYGDSYVADGDSWFSDTSTLMTEADPTFGGEAVITPGTSLSGTYHMGYLWDENYYSGVGLYPMVLVADESTAGVYDTVYVDLFPDGDFSYEKPCTKASPTSYLDLWDENDANNPDGFADISGGMIYWIADGTNQPPGVDFMFGGAPTEPGPGDMVCFMGSLNIGEDHGTLCSSNVVGQGLTDSPSYFGDYPVFKTPEGGGNGIIQGAGKDAELVAIADIYWNHFASTLAAYDYATFGLDETPGTGDDVQVVSNSYGESDDDADSWDYRSRYLTALNTYVNPNTSFLFSTGNGAPGYGTNAPPSPATGIAVGASTQMGAAGGWDSIYDIDQVTVGDVIPWSNRGPSAGGGLAPNIVADGAYSSGAIPVNFAFNGAYAWDVWGGTSRSCPVAAGNLALVYEAYKDANGGWPTYEVARQLLMNGARDLNYDTFTQGAGMLDAGRSVSLAASNGGVEVAPAVWEVGDFLGQEHLSFMNAMHAGDSYTTDLTVTNKGASSASVEVSDAWYQETSSTSLDVTMDAAEENAYSFDRPDHLTDITDMIPDGTDLVVARATQDFEEFAPTGAFTTGSTTHNVVRALVYDWKDQDADGELWSDVNDNGYVNVGEIDPGEYMRFTYHNNFANTHEVRVQTPLDRMHDGVFLGLQHTARATGSGVTTVHVELSFYSRADMPWLDEASTSVDLAAGESADIAVTADVPADTAVGIYEGEYRIDDGTNVSIVPVVMNVVSPTYGFRFGEQDGPGQVDSIMPNNQLFGAQDWNWRAESGDWRFFSADGSGEEVLPDGAAWLVHTSWPDNGAATGHQTDNDTLLYGPAWDEFSNNDPDTFGPYSLGLAGGSANNNIGAGIWTFQTNSGTTEEWVASALDPGLNQIMVHNVLYDGKQSSAVVSGEAGVISVMPSELAIVSSAASGSEAVDFATYTLGLSGVTVESFGLTKKAEESAETSTGADWYKELMLTNAAYLDVQTACPGTDIDLYVYRWNGSGYVLVGASETSSGEESVRIERPTDGDYLIDVYGYSVSGTQTFDISISSPMGSDTSVIGVPVGPVDPGSGFAFGIDWSKDRTALVDREGSYEGIVYLGPTEAPGAVQVPVSLRYPFEVESSTPMAAETVKQAIVPIEVTMSKRVDQTTLDDTTFHLMRDGSEVSGTIAYDDTSATLSFTPDAPLAHLGEYEILIENLGSVDGDFVDSVVPFAVDLIDRAAGADRYQTAIDVSAKSFASADTVLLATGERFPDALAASGLAGVLDAPLLLTEHDALPDAVADEIARLGATSVVVIGGPDAVSDDVVDAVDALSDVDPSRVFGADRYATAAEVAREIAAIEGDGLTDTCFLARGDTFPDALALSPFAYSQSIPILLTKPEAMPAVTADVIAELGFSEMLVAGDTEAVSLEAASVKGMSRVDRAGGIDRYATAAEVAAYGGSRGWGTFGFVGVATGTNFPDGLAGGVGVGASEGVLLLTPPTTLSGHTADAISANIAQIGTVEIFGGPSAIADSVRDAISDLLAE